MAELLSIASGALAVTTASTQTVSVISKFIQDCKEARADLTQVTRELSGLNLILERLQDNNATTTKNCLPNALQTSVQAMLISCTTIMQHIEETLDRCRGKPGPLLWTTFEKDKMIAFKVALEASKSGLNIALETVNMFMIWEIKNKTNLIRNNTGGIKRNTSDAKCDDERSMDTMLDEIHRLRTQLPPSYPSDRGRLRLEQWLDTLTQYAETIAGSEGPGETLGAVSLFEVAGKREEAGAETTTNRLFCPTPPKPLRDVLPSPRPPARASPRKRISSSRRLTSEFAKLEAYDPNWRENFGKYLSEHGLEDEFIKDNQDFIVEFLEENKTKVTPRRDPMEERAELGAEATNRISDSTLPELSRNFLPLLQPYTRPSAISRTKSSSKFAKLAVYDPDWRVKFGNFLYEQGIGDDFIEENQDFIIECLEDEKEKKATSISIGCT
ncbi:hypothetical protein GGS24DRAFT_101764 [Hypoxylon argillaceum]|nr:hypothetical protein GGS24DRAFT_101764 [Hypoxylon argillaceum]